MQILKRVLSFFTEVGILVLGFVLSVAASYFTYLLTEGDGPTVPMFFFPLTLSAVCFFLIRRKTRKWKVQYDAENFLKYRASKRLNPLRASRLRVFSRCLIWVPCIIVSLVLPFIPEGVGIASHLFVTRISRMGKYRVPMPITWIVPGIVDGEQERYLSAMTVPGIGRTGFGRYWRREVPLSEMVIWSVPHPEDQIAPNVYLEGETVLSKLSMPFGNETLTCWDLIHNNPFVGSSLKDHSIADISCTTETDDFYAHFVGWRRDAADFFQTLKRITISVQE